MIPCETSLRQIPKDRYRRLCGPFTPAEAALFQAVTGFLRATGARIATVSEPEGVVIWRLRSECETLEDTEARLRKQGRRPLKKSA